MYVPQGEKEMVKKSNFILGWLNVYDKETEIYGWNF